MRSTWGRRLGVVVAIAVGLAAAGGIAYAAIPGSRGAVRSPLGSPAVFLAGSSGTVAIGPHFGTTVGLGSANIEEAPVSMPVSGTLGHLHVALDHNVGSPGVNVSIHVNGTPTSMVCTIGSGRRRCSDKTHSVAVNEGDLVDAFAVNNTGGDVYVSWSVRVG